MAGEKKTVVKPFRMTEKEAEKLKSDAMQRGKAVPQGGQGASVSLYEEAEFAGKRGGGYTWQSVRYFISVTVVPVMQESI